VKRRTVNGTASSYFAAASVFLMLISLERSVYPILLAAAVLFHELGHVAMAYLVGASISGAGSGLYRLCLYYDPARLSYRKEAWICAGGVIFNLILAALSTLFLPISQRNNSLFLRFFTSFFLFKTLRLIHIVIN